MATSMGKRPKLAPIAQAIASSSAALGPSFLTTMDDHGANAPPAWLGLARLVIGHVPANETTLTIAGLIDAALFVALAFTMWACFGLVPMLVAMTIFGATDLYMFGTNWTGATLRHDWLVLLGFAVCALRKQRWALAGALLGTGTILRVIPGIGFFGIVAPAGAWLISRWMRREMPDVRALLAEHRAAARVIAGAAATMLAIFVLTGLLYGFDAWREWWVRVRALNADLATNEVTLRMLIVGVDQTSGALLRERWPLFVLADVAGVVVVLRAARQRPLEDALLLALPLALLLLNPANYHVHFVFLLALLGAGPGRNLLAIAAPLLLFCLAGFWVDLDPDSARHFEQLTALLFAALAFVYLEVIRPRQTATVATAPPPSVA